MKKAILIIQILVLSLTLVFAQEVKPRKKINFGIDASLIIFPVNVFDKNTCVYGLHPTVYYNLNEHFFLQTGIGLENGKYNYYESFVVNNITENIDYIQEYLRFGIPVTLGFQHNLFNDKFNLNTKIGVVYNMNLCYYDYVHVSNAPYLNHETYFHPNLKESLSWARFALYYSIGIEKYIVNKHSIGFSYFLLILHQHQIVRYLWQYDYPSRFQTGIKLTYKFNCNE